MVELNEKQRGMLLDRVALAVEKKFYDPMLNGVHWRGLVEESRGPVVRAGSTEEFEKEINELLKKLRTSHIGLFHQSVRKASSRQAIAATFSKAETEYGTRWVFQDVHSEGPAELAGIESGDVLLRMGDQDIVPPESPWFAMGTAHSVTIAKRNGSTRTFTLSVPVPKSLKPPVAIPRTVSSRQLPEGIGLLKVTMFPGIVGVDVANEMTEAVRALDCDRLIVDLRGNTGGGIGCLRLMSLLCPDKTPVGYSLSRRAAERGARREDLPKFDRIPSEKRGLIPLLFRFAFRDRSVAVIAEGLGPQKFHGRVAILVNEHSASAAEMVAAFAAENGLARIVGTKTAGRLMGASAYKMGFGYRLALPVAAFRTWRGTMLEGAGVEPDVPAGFKAEAVVEERDPQLEAAIRAVY